MTNSGQCPGSMATTNLRPAHPDSEAPLDEPSWRYRYMCPHCPSVRFLRESDNAFPKHRPTKGRS